MPKIINSDIISSIKQKLEDHPIYEAVESIEDLQCFMEHHVYSVWDFMSLVKYVQATVAPAKAPWLPGGDSNVQRFINELVLEEETDEGINGEGYSSHFELYQQAMLEIGADISKSNAFLEDVRMQGVNQALYKGNIPTICRDFTEVTFSCIAADKPHEVAASLALGREHIIPIMFRAILNRTGVSESQAPTFHYYLNRHVHMDEEVHGPLSLRLLNGLCDGDTVKIDEAIIAAQTAVEARVKLWDDLLLVINHQKQQKTALSDLHLKIA
ncbi:DUF3050 domain-containing protein [Cocleimonas sp. KMM 6892]|uniref:DUF3050 domain-containing protein n=1 Tax=unclassified Cocleimonas TaxID=2639732 RepID=UPI002DBC858C|nr:MULTISPECIES: DUF3050 domain-containing protein [unclassified Cocleimonas]MEB8433016.1 DUF3050 domain-containing protein [Cocleimonas sp. KMM 6892]MEC4716003.1 DUF3050 domain-containing protein [Cocleimonas sp. KMM 6895]MEC4745464.1 DUF3050 domain-containing protein [Cocleimonas sp. KMM 6896]